MQLRIHCFNIYISISNTTYAHTYCRKWCSRRGVTGLQWLHRIKWNVKFCSLLVPFFDIFPSLLLYSSVPPYTTARKNKKLIKMKAVNRPSGSSEPVNTMPVPVIPRCMPQLVPTMLSVLKAIEPEIIYSGYDCTLPETASRLMTTLNRLGGQQVISAVKWAKSLPGWCHSLPCVAFDSVRCRFSACIWI